MRIIITCLFAAALALPLAGCGGGGALEPGMPKDTAPPPADFDPAGGIKPDMSGKKAPRTP